jgi:hypothetical protein
MFSSTYSPSKQRFCSNLFQNYFQSSSNLSQVASSSGEWATPKIGDYKMWIELCSDLHLGFAI